MSKSTFSLASILKQLAEGNDISARQAESMMRSFINGDFKPIELGCTMMGMRLKGETADELAGMVGAYRAASVPVRTPTSASEILWFGLARRRLHQQFRNFAFKDRRDLSKRIYSKIDLFALKLRNRDAFEPRLKRKAFLREPSVNAKLSNIPSQKITWCHPST